MEISLRITKVILDFILLNASCTFEIDLLKLDCIWVQIALIILGSQLILGGATRKHSTRTRYHQRYHQDASLNYRILDEGQFSFNQLFEWHKGQSDVASAKVQQTYQAEEDHQPLRFDMTLYLYMHGQEVLLACCIDDEHAIIGSNLCLHRVDH